MRQDAGRGVARRIKQIQRNARAPVALQLVHLLLSDVVWIALVLLAAATLAEDRITATANASATGARSQRLASLAGGMS